MVSIIVLMYNEEKYIIDTLESIKYQMENFGKDIKVQLILGDDGSKDRTREFADLWLQDNADLFKDIVRLYGEKNIGTCKKYSEVLRAVKGERFVSIAGDDIFSVCNLFEKLELCNEKDILMNAVICFSDNGIMENKGSYNDVVLQSLVTSKNIHWLSKLGSPVLNGALYRKDIMSEDVLKYIEKFELVDDRPRVYKIVSNKSELRVGYDNSPILLSRRHNQSVSNFQSPHLNVHNSDLYRLYDDIITNENSYFMKWCVKRQKSTVKYRGQKGLRSKLKYLSPYYFALGVMIIVHWYKLKQMKNELLTKYSKDNNVYLLNIQKATLDFYKKHNII